MLANDTWFYSAEQPEGHLFWAGEIPGEGWYDTPAAVPKVAPTPIPEPEVVEPGGCAPAVLVPAKPRKKAAAK